MTISPGFVAHLNEQIVRLTDRVKTAEAERDALRETLAALRNGRRHFPTCDLPDAHSGDCYDALDNRLFTSASEPPPRPPIVCLCGSRRFAREIEVAAIDRTLRGWIVLRPDVTHPDIDGAAKAALDELHLRKIDLADEVLILNVGGYIGENTRREIDYAISRGKSIRYLEPLGSRPAPPRKAASPTTEGEK